MNSIPAPPGDPVEETPSYESKRQENRPVGDCESHGSIRLDNVDATCGDDAEVGFRIIAKPQRTVTAKMSVSTPE